MMKWQPQKKASFCQGVALQKVGRHADALAAFASGLARDPKSLQLQLGVVEAAMMSPIKDSFNPAYRKLRKMKLHRNSFLVVSVVGQELLNHGYHDAAAIVLEAGLKIGTCSPRLRGSVFSALSSAYWSLGDVEKSMDYMQRDLEAAKTLGDQSGECRVYGNLGSAFFSKSNYREALANHRRQLVLAVKIKDTEAASIALCSLGHVYTAVGDYPNALASHKRCVLLARRTRCRLSEARHLGDMGAVYTALGDFANAVECHRQHLEIALTLEDKREKARAYSNLGSAHHSQRDFDKALSYHTKVLQLARELEDRPVEMRAYAGLGHAARCMQDTERALQYHQKQLEIAQELQDRAAHGRASSNLGIVYQIKGDYQEALKLHEIHLSLAQELEDHAGQGRAYGNIGNAYHALGMFDQAVHYHRQELRISAEVNDRLSQASTHGNLAVAYQALGAHEQAQQHYARHLAVTRELRDAQSEARALANLGNFHSCRGEFTLALPYYEQYLALAPCLQDLEGEGKVCHNLGYIHYCLGQYKEAIRYYEQGLASAKDLQDKLAQAKAYCNLGLAHKALGEYKRAEECQKYLLSLGQALDNSQAIFRALGNLGDICVCRGDLQEAVKFNQQQLSVAQKVGDRKMEAEAYGALGTVHRLLPRLDSALSFHNLELAIRKDLGDPQGECLAVGHLAAVHMSLGDYASAFQCYSAQLRLARNLRDVHLLARVHGDGGVAKMNAGLFEEAVGCFEQQLAMLEQLSGNEAAVDRGRSQGNLARCYEALADYEEAIRNYEKYLTAAQSSNSIEDQEAAYRGIGRAHSFLGNLQQALVCFEKRLVLAHELDDGDGNGGKALAYGELGALHCQLGNYEQALTCLEHRLNIARLAGDESLEAEASDELGAVYKLVADYETALQWHRRALEMAEKTGCARSQCRSYGNLGLTYEAMGNHERAVFFQEQHLSLAAETNDPAAKTLAYASLGRVHHALRNYDQAVMYLQEGLRLAEQLCCGEDEAEIRHRLGLSSWAGGDLEEAQRQLYRATALFEEIRHQTRQSRDYKLSLFRLQTSSYQALQRVLVGLGRHEDALAVAERGRISAFADLLVERQKRSGRAAASDLHGLVTVETVLEKVDSQDAAVLYYSLAGGFLYSWLISPGAGIVKFHQVFLGESGPDEFWDGGESLPRGGGTLEGMVCRAKEAAEVGEDRSGKQRSEVRSANAVKTLYDLLIGPMERDLAPTGLLVLVLEAELYLVPFAMLRGDSANQFLHERFRLIFIASLTHLKPRCRKPAVGTSIAAVVGPPNLAPSVADRRSCSAAEEEALWVARQLRCRALTGGSATKERVVSALRQAECVHFATHVSWKLTALLLNPNGKTDGCPPLHDFLLTAADILDLNLTVKLVVLRCFPDSVSAVTSDGLVALTRSFLASGVQCVCVSLWATPDPAYREFSRAFYARLLNGSEASVALSEAMKTLQRSTQFSHPHNWAGYMLIGCDVKLSSHMTLVRNALTEILQHPEKTRKALRVLLHLVEKSLQRIRSGHSAPMYTYQQGVEDKVGGVHGWKPLLSAVGFQLDVTDDVVMPAVFFPTSDPGERLQWCSAALQAILGLSSAALMALCKLIQVSESAEKLISKLRDVSIQLWSGDEEQDFLPVPVQMTINASVWRRHGCHEFLAALGFDLCEVGREDVVLKTGKQASARNVHFAVQSLLVLFDSTEMPVDISSSPEFVCSRTAPRTSFLTSPCGDNLSGDAISVYSLSSLASSLGFLSRPEPAGSDAGRGLTLNTSTDRDEAYEGFSIVSSEPLECQTPPSDAGSSARVRKSGLKATKCHEISSSQHTGKANDRGSERDQSRIVGHREERIGPAGRLDPEELAKRILEETQSHMEAVENLQKAGGARRFQPSETSAFSRPLSRTRLRTCPSLFSNSKRNSAAATDPLIKAKPPSLHKIDSSTSPDQGGEKQTVRDLKTFWANVGRNQESPSLLPKGNKKMSKVQNDVLGLLSFSQRRQSDADGRNQNREVKLSPSLEKSSEFV